VDVQKIKVEGTRIDPVRNVERLWLEVVCAVGNGCGIEGHIVRGHDVREDGSYGPVPTRIEVYADRLGAVLERVRTDAHRMIHERAAESAQILTDQWIREKGPAFKRMLDTKSPEERARIVGLQCNIRPEIEYARLGYRTGIPPLESCHVVSPKTGKTIDAREFQKLPHDKQREWLVDAPMTPTNAAQRANENLAHQIAQAIRESRSDKR
jgi:hypothetical protein